MSVSCEFRVSCRVCAVCELCVFRACVCVFRACERVSVFRACASE